MGHHEFKFVPAATTRLQYHLARFVAHALQSNMAGADGGIPKWEWRLPKEPFPARMSNKHGMRYNPTRIRNLAQKRQMLLFGNKISLLYLKRGRHNREQRR